MKCEYEDIDEFVQAVQASGKSQRIGVSLKLTREDAAGHSATKVNAVLFLSTQEGDVYSYYYELISSSPVTTDEEKDKLNAAAENRMGEVIEMLKNEIKSCRLFKGRVFI